MRNYWLSELEHQDLEEELLLTDDDSEVLESEDEIDIHHMLSPRQLFMYDKYEEMVEEFGMFDFSTGPNGAHYMPASQNAFKTAGLVCRNCAFYMQGGGCEIVSGRIQPGAVCKFWIIPEELLKKKKKTRKNKN